MNTSVVYNSAVVGHPPTHHPITRCDSKPNDRVVIITTGGYEEFKLWAAGAIEPHNAFVTHVPVDSMMSDIWATVPCGIQVLNVSNHLVRGPEMARADKPDCH